MDSSCSTEPSPTPRRERRQRPALDNVDARGVLAVLKRNQCHETDPETQDQPEQRTAEAAERLADQNDLARRLQDLEQRLEHLERRPSAVMAAGDLNTEIETGLFFTDADDPPA